MAVGDHRRVIAVADPAALAKAAADRLMAEDRGEYRPHRDLPDRRIEPESSSINCSRPTPIAAESRGTACTGSSATSVLSRLDDPLNNMAMARRSFSTAARRRQHPSDSDRYRQSAMKRAALRARAEILLWRRSAGFRQGRCSISCCWASAPTAIPPRCFPAIRRVEETRALGGRRAQGPCRAVRAAGDADPAGARLLPRNAVRGRRRGQTRDPDARPWRARTCRRTARTRPARPSGWWIRPRLPENFRER